MKAGVSTRPCASSRTPRRAPPCDGMQRLLGNAVALAMHAVRFDLFDAHRLERAEADVQSEARGSRAALLDAPEHRMVEMQAGGRRRDRAGLRGIYRLVALD